jgi:hypothetical protein
VKCRQLFQSLYCIRILIIISQQSQVNHAQNKCTLYTLPLDPPTTIAAAHFVLSSLAGKHDSPIIVLYNPFEVGNRRHVWRQLVVTSPAVVVLVKREDTFAVTKKSRWLERSEYIWKGVTIADTWYRDACRPWFHRQCDWARVRCIVPMRLDACCCMIVVVVVVVVHSNECSGNTCTRVWSILKTKWSSRIDVCNSVLTWGNQRCHW